MRFKVALAQLNSTDDLADNINQITEFVIKAKEGRANLVCLPEHCLYYPKSSKDLRQNVDYMNSHQGVRQVQSLAQNFGIDILIGSVAVEVKSTSKLRNRSIYVGSSGEILAHYDKVHLFNATVGGISQNESRRFEAGHNIKVYWTKFGKLGMSVCNDVRFPYQYRKMAQKGAQMFTIPGAFSMETGKIHWHTLCRARAIENGAFVFAPNQCGIHGRRKHFGHSLIISPEGLVLAEASSNKPEIIFADINPDEVIPVREKFKFLAPDKLSTLHKPSKKVGLLKLFGNSSSKK
jgi:predicted amidohydrolase